MQNNRYCSYSVPEHDAAHVADLVLVRLKDVSRNLPCRRIAHITCQEPVGHLDRLTMVRDHRPQEVLVRLGGLRPY